MNNKKIGTAKSVRGITLIEIFVALTAAAILLASASSPLKRISARADVDIAGNNVMYALHAAERSAMQANIPVRVFFNENASNNRLVAGFSRHRGAIEFYALPYYALPEDVTVSLSAGMSVIEYLPGGKVYAGGVITLSSRDNPEYVVEIPVDGGEFEKGSTLRAPASP